METDISISSDKFSWGQPLSLLSSCIEYVAKHLDLVESFQDFPDLLGKEIFLAAERNEQFANPSAIVFRRLELFSTAFVGDFLQSLYLSQHHLLVNYLSEDFTLFAGVQSLDLSHCGLSDDHELLFQLSYFTNLTTLSLRDNALTHRGLQKLTIPLRMFERGPKDLEALDLSENPDLTAHGMRYLKVFSQLRVLNLSNTAITRTDIKLKQLSMKICSSEENTNGPENYFDIETQGWATDVVSSWVTWYNSMSKRPRLGENSFYSKRRLKYKITKDEPITKKKYHLILKK